MGITGGLAKSVFSKSWSLGSHDNNARTEKRRWNSVRSYLCGDELSSGLRDEDYHGSVESFSEATTAITQFNSTVAEHNSEATQPHSVPEENDSGSVEFSEETVTQQIQKEEQKEYLESKAAKDERAAIIIQSAFRGFLARRLEGGTGLMVRSEIPNRESSLGTSVEVQMGNSLEEEWMAIQHRTNQKLRPQVIKEDWDDSTVSSNISRMRIQSRQEATTRRERALAYAFSQQLRVCSKKKEAKSSVKEASMGWSWLERWMATRLPESSSAESCCFASKSPEQIKKNQRSSIFDVLSSTGVEKESCGSNDVSASFSANEGDGFSVSVRRKTVPRRKAGTRGYAR